MGLTVIFPALNKCCNPREGFFELCRLRGLDGTQGVIIPRRNIMNLMLRKDVIDTVRDGKFSLYPIDTVEEGLEILTGKAAGVLQDDGTYPAGTINALVVKRLTEIAEALKEKKEEKEDKEGEKKKNDES